MPFTVSEVKDEASFVPVGKCMDHVFSNPPGRTWTLLKGDSNDEFISRFWQWHLDVPGSVWIKAVDDETGEIAGAAEWIIFDEKPSENGLWLPKAAWWKDDVMQDITQQFTDDAFGRRAGMRDKPQCLLNILFVHPNYRRRGIGGLLTDWGVKIADEKGIDSFIEASLLGKPVYQKRGFNVIGMVGSDPKLPEGLPEEKKKQWQEAHTKFFTTPIESILMWRPKHGEWMDENGRFRIWGAH